MYIKLVLINYNKADMIIIRAHHRTEYIDLSRSGSSTSQDRVGFGLVSDQPRWEMSETEIFLVHQNKITISRLCIMSKHTCINK